jgi:Spy/CpxP family protein refolding chaperone
MKLNNSLEFKQMGKQRVNQTKKILGILLIVFFVAAVAAPAVSAYGSYHHHGHHSHNHHSGGSWHTRWASHKGYYYHVYY